ncbi:snRNA-activating protein complex subunit 1-like [Hippocampus zosterae]|uniref:snRNA-activating protein complex subunit 1-like n=1 Tax=Hippocampus zosterae TaxID=109293 RepID=UPI00223CFDA2|nr:snRNA-activating protein complex subunit 1-like [Hippocampus zosterae]
MPRMPPKYADNFYEPLTEDVETFLGRFQHIDSVRLERFTALWRDARFSDVFLGIPSMSEMRRFCRVAMATAVKYFLPPYCYQVRVGGLYLMFAFYHTQLATPPVRVRLPLRDWDDVQKFLQDSIACRHLDVIYVYRKLVSVKAMEYTAMPHLLVFQRPKKAKEQRACAGMLARVTAVQELLTEDYLEEVANVQNHYHKIKSQLVEVSLQATVTHADFALRLQDASGEFLKWQQKTLNQTKDTREDEDKPTEQEERHSRVALLASIKKRGYRRSQGGSKYQRHSQEEEEEEEAVPAAAAEDSSSSALELQGPDKNNKALSLRARTWKALGKNLDKSELQTWLLSAPDQERVPLRRKNRQGRYNQ